MGYIAGAATARQPSYQQNTIGKREDNAFVRSFGMLTTAGLGVVMLVGEIMIVFSTIMTILALYYSFIKRVILLFGMRRKLKKGAEQNLGHDQVEGRGQRTVLATQLRAFSFQESLELSRKDYCIIFFLAFILMMLFVGLIAFFAFFPRSTIFLHGYALQLFKVSVFVVLLLLWCCVCMIIALPVILIFHSFLHYSVKKTVKRLETFA
ncbi:hypothetical protein [Bartonella sp. AA1HLJMS]|uniref:hypothetical protein n=1 Tax=Bartonella sp. AA1HLJMS TaxID=3243424 RepID=UPI0035CEBD2C